MYRIRTYTERTERSLDTVQSLTDYILLILVVSSIFALVILRSAHDSFFDSLSRTLRIVETLGFSRKRQKILFALVYSLILPVGFVIAGGISYVILGYIATFPEAESFIWVFSSFFLSLVLLGLLLLAAFFPAWQTRWFPQFDNWNRYGLGIITLVELIVGISVIALIFSDIVFALMVVVG